MNAMNAMKNDRAKIKKGMRKASYMGKNGKTTRTRRIAVERLELLQAEKDALDYVLS